MKVIAVLALCLVGTLAKPHAYGYSQQQPDIRVESYTNAPPAAPADQPAPSNNGYYYHHQPMTTSAPPSDDKPTQSNYYYQAPPMTTTTTTAAPPPPPASSPPMQPNYHYYYQPKETTTAAPPADDTPMQNYGSYSSGSSSQSSSKPSLIIVRHHHLSDNKGNYQLNVESSDGSTHVESGSLKNLGHPEGLTGVKEGSFSWTSPEGQLFSLTYTADENGFVAKGDHLPTSPPMPEEIRKSLALPRVSQDSYYSAPSSAQSSPPMSNNNGYSAPSPQAVFSPPMNNNHYGYSAPPSSDFPSIRIESFSRPPKGYYN